MRHVTSPGSAGVRRAWLRIAFLLSFPCLLLAGCNPALQLRAPRDTAESTITYCQIRAGDKHCRQVSKRELDYLLRDPLSERL